MSGLFIQSACLMYCALPAWALAVDIWAAGVLLYTLVSRAMPFGAEVRGSLSVSLPIYLKLQFNDRYLQFVGVAFLSASLYISQAAIQ